MTKIIIFTLINIISGILALALVNTTYIKYKQNKHIELDTLIKELEKLSNATHNKQEKEQYLKLCNQIKMTEDSISQKTKNVSEKVFQNSFLIKEYYDNLKQV